MYNKRDMISCMIKEMHFLPLLFAVENSNTPNRIFHAEVGSEVLCLARTTSSEEKFQK